MSNMKGLSQILYLIIAASVLMIAALSLVFMLDEGLSGLADFGGNADWRACSSAIDAACTGGSSSISTPEACITTDADGNREVIQRAQAEYGASLNSVSCSN